MILTIREEDLCVQGVVDFFKSDNQNEDHVCYFYGLFEKIEKVIKESVAVLKGVWLEHEVRGDVMIYVQNTRYQVLFSPKGFGYFFIAGLSVDSDWDYEKEGYKEIK